MFKMTATETQQERIETLLSLKENHIEQIELINSELDELGYKQDYSDDEVVNRLIDSINQVLETNIRIKSRTSTIVKGRQFFYHYMRENTALSLKEIASKLLIQDHSTVINSIRMFENHYIFDKAYKREYDRCIEVFKNKL
jgi:chromosomal replication initiation ATPase DnaA